MTTSDITFLVIAFLTCLGILIASGTIRHLIRKEKPAVTLSEIQEAADMFVRAVEQSGKIQNMDGPQKKMIVHNLLDQAIPGIPDTILDAAIEGAVYLLDKTESYWTAPNAGEAK